MEEKTKMDRMQELALLAKQNEIDKQVDQTVFPSAWKLSEQGIAAIKHGVAMNKTTHGLYASVPMICKGAECQYAEVCPMLQQGYDPSGERCPLEISLILTKFEDYKKKFMINENDPDDYVDLTLIKDLIDYDVQVMRAENKMAIDGDFVEDNVVGIGDGGDPIIQKQISKAAEYKDKIMVKKHRVLELMNSTRKDKAGAKLTVQMDPSTYAAQLLSQIEQMPGEVIDAEWLESIREEEE